VTARRAALLAGLLAAAVAAPSIRNGFTADDRWVIAERPFLKHPPSVGALLREPYWPAGFGGVMWRPAVLTSFALDYRLGGGTAWFHTVNVLWAAIAAALLTLLACRLADPVTGLVAGLLFAVHPVHVEAVANVVGRADLMAAAGYAAALLCAMAAERRRIFLVGVAAAAAFAIVSKEHVATLPAAILLVGVARRADLRSAAWPAAVAAFVIVAYFVLRTALGQPTLSAGGLAPGLAGLGVLERAWAMAPISLVWWRLFLFPVQLSSDYSPGDVVVSTALTLGHVLAIAVWAAAGWAAWRWRKSVPGLAVGLAWMVITVSPVANIVVPTELLVAERTLYLPSWGMVFALAAVGMALPWPARWRVALLGMVLVLGATRSIARAPVWHDDETLYQAVKRDAPQSYRTLWFEGKDEFQAGHWGSGERLLRAAIAAAPEVVGPRYDLATFYWRAGLSAAAAEQLRQATMINEGFAPAWALLPRVLFAAGDTAGAKTAAREALRRFPNEAAVVESAAAVLGR
jgi:protein O-mannosyl-transferase